MFRVRGRRKNTLGGFLTPACEQPAMPAELDIAIRTRRGKVFVSFEGPDVSVEYPMQPEEARQVGEGLVEAADSA
jgi:hypothetical protein